MGKKIYKYFSSDILERVFQRSGFAGIRCSFPKDYNDPYELFLGVDLDVSTDILATYQDIVQELPQLPTTCFSKSPVVSPMWAHYGSNHSGFVLEFDVDALELTFEDAVIRIVEYKDAPDQRIAESLSRVAQTKKPRHAVWLRQTVLSEAYFSKQTAWQYEHECRFVDFHDYVEDVDGNMILFVPIHCATAIIVGHKFPETMLEASLRLAQTNGIDWYRSIVGKARLAPFLNSETGHVFEFDGDAIVPARNICRNCSEPTPESYEFCSWCRISAEQQIEAAKGNPFRILDHYGLLDGYLEEVGKIERRRK